MYYLQTSLIAISSAWKIVAVDERFKPKIECFLTFYYNKTSPWPKLGFAVVCVYVDFRQGGLRSALDVAN